MKTLFKTLLAISLLFAVTISFAQTAKTRHDSIAGYYKKAKEHLSKIKTGSAKDKEANRMHAKEAAKNLALAKAQYKAYKASIPAKYNAIAAPHYAAIDQYHTEADKDSGNLNDVLEQAEYNDEKAKEYSAYFYTDLTNAEAEHEKLHGDVSFQ